MATARTLNEVDGASFPSFTKLDLQRPTPNILHIVLNDSKGNNRWNDVLFNEFIECFRIIPLNRDIYCVLISANSKHFTVGLDLKWASQGLFDGTQKKTKKQDVARKAIKSKQHIAYLQKSTNLIASCPVPVVVAVNGGCFGMGIDLITACDIRYCSKDSFYSVKEVDIAITADVGSLARLPKIIGNHSMLREFVYTGRSFKSSEALEFGLVNKIFDNKNKLIEGSLSLCRDIASKSPIAIRGIKEMLNYEMSGKSPADLQHYVAALNGAYLQTDDVAKAAMSFFQKKQPKFSKL